MQKHVRNAISHPLIKGSTIVLVGSLIANLFNYTFSILILGHVFHPADYGTYSALMSFLGLFGIFPSTFTTIFAKFAAMYKAKNDIQNIQALFIGGLRIVTIFGSIVFLLLLISTPYISAFFHIQDMTLLFLIFLTIFLSIVASLPTGIIQGEIRLYLMSLYTLSTPLIKVIIGVFLLFLGLKIFGVVVAIFISSLIPLIFLLLMFRRSYKIQNAKSIDQSFFFKEFRGYSLEFFLANLGITILASSDVIFVKHFFSPDKAGQYAALAAMGRSIFYLTSPIYFVFFPLIAQKKERKESIFNTVLLAICIITLGSVGLSFVYFLFPTLILSMFFPAHEYKSLVSYLGPFSLYIIIFSIAMLFNNFLLSIGKGRVYKINLLVAGVFMALIYLFHASFYQIITVLFITAFLLLALQLLYYVSTTYGKKKIPRIHNYSNI